jgi:hypothetical protein
MSGCCAFLRAPFPTAPFLRFRLGERIVETRIVPENCPAHAFTEPASQLLLPRRCVVRRWRSETLTWSCPSLVSQSAEFRRRRSSSGRGVPVTAFRKADEIAHGVEERCCRCTISRRTGELRLFPVRRGRRNETEDRCTVRRMFRPLRVRPAASLPGGRTVPVPPRKNPCAGCCFHGTAAFWNRRTF